VAVLFMGTRDRELDVQKGLPALAAACARLASRNPELLLVVAGAGGRARTGAIPRIDLGPVGAADKASLYRSVDVLALPSLAENMPNVVLEAMAAGVPVVASSVGALPEMIDDGESGFLVAPGDVDTLVERLERLVRDPALRARLGARAATAACRYDLAVLERRLLSEYGRLARRPASAQAAIVWHRRPALQRRLRLLRRVLAMSPGEIGHRVARIARKHRARLALATTRAGAAAGAPTLPFEPGWLSSRTSARGFFDLPDRERLVARARAHLPRAVRRTVDEAAAVLAEGVELLGKRFRPAAPDFDWLADPERGRLWPRTVLDDADAVRRVRGDVKFVWEVNRHQFLVTVARAHAYTAEPRFATACLAMVRAWIAANPPGRGVNWASNLEVGVRALSWVWALHFLAGSPAVASGDLDPWLASLRAHRDHLARHLSIHTDPTNHLIGEAAALAVLAIWLPEWEGAAEHRERALATLGREVERQVTEDGVGREQATSYQRFVVDFLLQVIVLADRNAIAIPPAIRARAARMVETALTLASAGGRAPRIGDADDARGLPFFTVDPWDFRELAQVGAAVLDGVPSWPAAGEPCESAFWLGAGRAQRSPGRAAPPARHGSHVLPAGGYAVLRSAALPGDRLLFDCGPLGYPPHASHGHADLLSVLVDLGGEELLIDPGTFAYADDGGRRDALRATRSHNTVEVGGRDQADAFDPFKWLNLPPAGIEPWRLGPDFDWVEAWHDGYRRLRPPVRHRRAVLGVPGGWLVIDWLEGRGRHDVARWFHAAPGTRIERLDPGAVRLWTPSRRSALVLRDLIGPDDRAATAVEETTGPYSERYGHLTSAPVLRLADEVHLPAVRVTALVRENAAAPLEVAATAGSRTGGVLSVRLGGPARREILLTVHGSGPAPRRGATAARPRAVVTTASDSFTAGAAAATLVVSSTAPPAAAEGVHARAS
jgi:hypothetical protein